MPGKCNDSLSVHFSQQYTLMSNVVARQWIECLCQLCAGQAPGRKQVRCMHSWIKAQKNMGRGPEDFLQTTTEGLVFREYQDLLMKCQCVDYDDIMTLAVNLLGDKERPNIRQTVQNRCPYMLVDEYQDSNAIQVKR